MFKKLRFSLRKFFVASAALFLLAPNFAFAQSLTIQGRVQNAAGVALNGSNVEFRVKILTPNSNRCVLFDETYVADLSQSNGLFSINLGTGLRTTNPSGNFSLDDAISNAKGLAVNSTYCDPSAGSGMINYSPDPTDNRKLIIQFKDPAAGMSSFDTIPEMDMNPVAYAMEARTVGGYPSTSILRVANSGSPGVAPIMNSAQITELQALVGGTSANYMSTTSGATTGARLPTVSGNPSAPATGSIWFDTSGSGAIKYFDSSGVIQTLGTGTGSGTITGVTAGTGLAGGGTSGSVTLSLSTSGVSASTYGSGGSVPVIQVDAYGRITSASSTPITGTLPSGTNGQFLRSNGTAWSSQKILLSDLKSSIGSANLFNAPGCSASQALSWDSITDQIKCQNISLPGSAITGTIAAAQLPAFTGGDVTAAAGSTALTLPNVVAANTYKSVTVDAKGRVTAGSNPTTLAGYGITDSLVANSGGVPALRAGVYSALPPAGNVGNLFISTDTLTLYRDNGTSWDIVGAAGAGSSLSGVTAGAGLTGGGSSGNVTVAMANVGTAGTYFKVTTDAQGRVSAGAASLLAADIPNLDWAKIASGKPTTLAGYGISDSLVQNAGGALSLSSGLASARPSSGFTAGRFYISTDTKAIAYDNGTAWVDIVNAAGGTGFTGNLSGDVTGTQGATVVAQVSGQTAANVAAGSVLANAATSLGTNNAIVKRDGAGGFAAGAISQSSLIFRDGSSNTVSLAAPSTVTTSYSLTLPPAKATVAGQVLTSDTSGVLSWSTPVAATSVSVTAPVTNSGTATAPNIGMPAATASVDGFLSAANFTTFTNKLSSALTSAYLFVGNAGGTATGVALSGDATLTNTGALTVTGIRGKSVTAAPTAAGQILRYNGTAFDPTFISIRDMRSSLTGVNTLGATCTASQTLTWDSVGDVLTCSNIAINASAITAGILPVANGGTGANSVAQNLIFASPAGSTGAPAFRALAASDLPASASFWQAGTPGINYGGGNVGIGTTSPAAQLQIGADNVGGRMYVNGNASGASPLSTSRPTADDAQLMIGRIGGSDTAGGIEFLTSPSGNGYGWKLAAPDFTAPDFRIAARNNSATWTERLRIAMGSGNVGIGTSAPSQILDVRSGAYGNNQNFGIQVGVPSGQWLSRLSIKSDGAGVARTSIDSTDGTSGGTTRESISILGSGNVGVGTAGPFSKLHVHTAAGSNNLLTMSRGALSDQNMFQFAPVGTASSSNPWWFVGSPTSSSDFSFNAYNGTTSPQVLTLQGSGNVGIAANAPVSKLHVGAAPSATANYGLVSLGDGPYDGTTAGYFTGNSNGTLSAGNAASGYTGDLLNYQVAGSSKFKVSAAGIITANGFNGPVTSSSSSTAAGYTINSDSDSAGSDGGVNIQVRGATKLAVTDGGNVAVGGETAPISLLANTSSNPLDSASTGVAATGITWLANAAGYVQSLTNSSTAGTANGLFVKTAGTAASNRLLTLNAAGTDVMAVTGQGRVGIGTTAPSSALELASAFSNTYSPSSSSSAFPIDYIKGLRLSSTGTSPPLISFQNGQNQGAYFGAIYGGAGNSPRIVFGQQTGLTSYKEAMRIDENSNVGIGTTAPTGKLQAVYNAGRFVSLVDSYPANVAGATAIFRNDDNGSTIPFAFDNLDSTAGIIHSQDIRARFSYTGGASAAVEGNYLRFGKEQEWTSTVSTRNSFASLWTTAGGTISEKFRVTSAGNVGIGTAVPNAALEVSGYISAQGTNAITSPPPAIPGSLGWKLGLWGNSYAMGIANSTLAIKANTWVSFFGNGFSPANDANTSPDSNSSINFNVNNGSALFSGNVGIGTTNPGAKLAVTADGGTTAGPALLGLSATGNGPYTWASSTVASALTSGNAIIHLIGKKNDSNNAGYIGYKHVADGSASNFLTFGIYGANDLMAVTGSGKVGIGLTNPTYQLQLSTDSAAKPGTSTWTIASDERLKDIRAPFARGLEDLLKLNTIYFRYKANNALGLPNDKEYVGIRAQDAEKAIPESVSRDEKGYLHVTNDAIIWTIVNSVKELYGKVTGADARIAALEAENAKLRTADAAKERRLASIEAKAKESEAAFEKRLKALEAASKLKH